MLAQRSNPPKWVTTRYHKWAAEERLQLFEKLAYFETPISPILNAIPKMGDGIETAILGKVKNAGKSIALHVSDGGRGSVNYSRKVGYFLQVLDFEPIVLSADGSRRPPSEFKTIFLSTVPEARAALAGLNSSLFYWFITLLSDCRHLNKREVEAFPIASVLLGRSEISRVDSAVKALMDGLKMQSENRTMRFRHDSLTVQCIVPKKSWAEIQSVDAIVANAFNLSQIEADYIASYDIKYRLGQSGSADAG